MEAKGKRIKELERLLKDTREEANREFKKQQHEKEQIKTALMEKIKEREREESIKW